MKTYNTRACAAEILTEVLNQQGSLTALLAEHTPQNLKPSDRRFIQELCYGVLRCYDLLDALVQQLTDKPIRNKDRIIKVLLLVGIYQIQYLQTPPHAAIHETVAATYTLKKTWASGLINAVLRRFVQNPTKYLELIKSIPTAHYSHPAWLLNHLQKSWPNDWESITHANNQHPPLTLRVNQQQITRDNYLELLNQQNIIATAAPYTKNGIILAIPCDVNLLPGFSEGLVSVQDAAAQLAAELLELQPDHYVLDACAAPGGKTAHILETAPQLKKLVVLEIDNIRAVKITANLDRLKLNLNTNNTIQLICADASQPDRWWDKTLFDRILIDAPCSATGVIRRHPDIKLLRRPEDISVLAATQLNLLNHLWPLLKPHGVLVYATCSVLPEENWLVLTHFLNTHPDAQEKVLATDWGITADVGRQILPGSNGMDGFYYGRLIKAD